MIPKKIHYCWFGGGELPEKDKRCIESWKKYCPDYEIIRWDESNYDISKCKYMKDAYDNKKWGFVPDYARLDIIYNEGGIYLDTDVEVIKCFDDLLNLTGFMGFENEKYVNLGSGFGAEKENHIIKRLRDVYDSKTFINADGTLNLIASPKYSTTILEKEGLKRNNITQELKGIKVFSSDYLSPLGFNDGVLRCTNHTYSIHWFNMSWKEKDEINLVFKEQKNIRKYGNTVGGILNYLLLIQYDLIKYGLKKTIEKVLKKIQRDEISE